jgi:8-hydroxy-5-deazaflavin:NADPH oxidoreductase
MCEHRLGIMKVGIIGAANMGRALGAGGKRAGHDILFGSRDRASAEAAAGNSGKRGDFDVSIEPRAGTKLAFGKVLIDCTNSAILRLEAPDPK